MVVVGRPESESVDDSVLLKSTRRSSSCNADFSQGNGLNENASAPASKNSFSLSLADNPQMRQSMPRERSSTTVSVPSSCFSTLAMYMSTKMRSNDSPVSMSRNAASPLAACRTVQLGDTYLTDRQKSLRSIASSSTNSTEQDSGSCCTSSYSKCALLTPPAMETDAADGLFLPLPDPLRMRLLYMLGASDGASKAGACMSMTNRVPGCPSMPLS
mmetsp:Transcript_10089/g.28743  ORF Transcript_10089/g.28743 Transcript_10089/m.28743 type:complete len:215 (-) Transcript_10089:2550-3194(-)